MSNELEGIFEGSGHSIMYYPSICFESLRKTTKNLSQDSQFPG
jgi:hypothetical protein